MEDPQAPDPPRGKMALRLRRAFRVAALLALAGLTAIIVEAVVRGRLPTPEERLPTALYTRPVPWGGIRSAAGPLPLGTLDGRPLELRIPVRLEGLPDHLVEAVLAIEDQRFFRHHGLDIRRIGGALLANLKAGAITQGGSTITQQLAKNLFLDASRTPLRKLREAAIALVLERRYSKQAILEAYLNEIYLGQAGARPIHGVGAAARAYFGKSAGRLTLAESALLAGMIRAPNRYAPVRNPAQARQRRQVVLDQMVEQKRLSRAAATRAARTRISAAVSIGQLDGRWFRDYLVPVLRETPRPRGTAIYTTIDARLQQAAERAVRRGLVRLSGAQGALVALDPATGDILAMVGGRDYRLSQFNRATGARRQPGSAFKPLVALTALEPQNGAMPPYTLASVVEDSPFAVATERGPWQPANYDRQYHGPVTLRQAMEHSLNIPFARIGMSVGPERIVATAQRLGIQSPLRPVPSLALGSSEVTLLELTRAYGVLAAGGVLASSRAVLGTAPHGRAPAASPPPVLSQVVHPAVAFLVTSTLQGVVTRGTGSALNSSGRYPGLAGKSGTTSGWRDAWFLAYSPSLVVGVWVGHDDGRSIGLTGSAAALPIVAAFLAEAATSREWNGFEVPQGVTEGYVTAGGSWPWECGEREYFLAGTEPAGSGCFGWDRGSWNSARENFEDIQREALRVLRSLLRNRR